MWSRIIFLFPLLSIALSADVQLIPKFVSLFDDGTQTKIQEIHQAIPGSLVMFLEAKNIIKPIHFRSEFEADGIGMGIEKHAVIHNFNTYLRKSIEGEFRQKNIEEIRPEDLSMDITQQYENKLFNRPAPGERNLARFQFHKRYKGKEGGKYRTAVFAYVFIEITETCENNWIYANERRFSYELKMELSGISIDEKKANILSEMITQDGVPNAIDHIKNTARITWDDL